MKNLLIIFLMILNLSILLEATTIDARFTVVTNNGINYIVKVQIKTDTGTDDLGTSNLYFTFNNTSLSFPNSPVAGVDYTYQNFSGGNYSAATVTKPQTNRLALNIELNIDNNGSVVTTDWMDVATINFVITNSNSSSNLSWLPSASQVVYDGNNSTLWTIGAFTDENTNPLPVELISFTASNNKNTINLKWETATETNNYGFEVERNKKQDANADTWEKLGFVNGNGTSNSPKSYSYEDKNIPAGKYSYRLKQIDNNGSFEYSSVVEVIVLEIPKNFSLEQNYPNPFNPTTTIKFGIVETAHTVVKIYDALGTEVAEIFNQLAEGGKYYYVNFNASNYASGIYYCTIASGEKRAVKKMLLMK